MLGDTDVQAIAADIFTKALSALGFERIEVTSGLDQDGDRSFFLNAFFKPGTEIARVRTLVDAQTELHDRLLARGEERFPYVSYRIPGGQEPLSDDLDHADAAHG